MENNDGMPFKYDMSPHQYVDDRICDDLASAKRIHRMLRGQAENVAKRDGIPVEQAFVRTFELHRDSRVMPEYRVAFNAEDLMGKLDWGFSYPEEADSMLRWILDRFAVVWAGQQPAIQADLFQRSLIGVVRIIYGHMSCGFIMRTNPEFTPTRDITGSLDLWAEVNWRVPFCHYRRLLQAADVRNLSRAKVVTLVRTHGSARLGDILQLMVDDLLSPALLDEFLAEPALFAALSYDDIRTLIPTRTEGSFRDVARTLADILPSLSKTPTQKIDPPIQRGLVAALNGLLPGWNTAAVSMAKREGIALRVPALNHVLEVNVFVPSDRAILEGTKADVPIQTTMDVSVQAKSNAGSVAARPQAALVDMVTTALNQVLPHIETNLIRAHKDLGIAVDDAVLDEKFVLFAQTLTTHLGCLEGNPAVLNSMRTGEVCFGVFALYSWWGGEVAPCVCMELSHLLFARGIKHETRIALPILFQPERAADLLGLARRAEFDMQEVGVMLRSSEVVERNDFASVVRMLEEWRQDGRKHSLYRYDHSAARSVSP